MHGVLAALSRGKAALRRFRHLRIISYLFVKLAHIDSAIYLSRSILQLFYVMYFNIYTIK